MTSKEMMNLLDTLIDSHPVGLLATMNNEKWPSMRWMTAGLVRGQQGRVYCLASLDSEKTVHVKNNPKVSWMFSDPGKNQVIHVYGEAQLVTSPDMISTVIEALGQNLSQFWKAHPDPSNLCVIETTIHLADLFSTQQGTHTQTKI